MIDRGHKWLSIVRQRELISILRASFYRRTASESPENLALMRLIDGAFLEMHARWHGTYGVWLVHWTPASPGADAQDRPRADLSGAEDQRVTTAETAFCPYLLRHMTIERPNHVWCVDVTYIPMRRGFLYSSPAWSG
jgi:putative transposase